MLSLFGGQAFLSGTVSIQPELYKVTPRGSGRRCRHESHQQSLLGLVTGLVVLRAHPTDTVMWRYEPGSVERLWEGNITGSNCMVLLNAARRPDMRAALTYTSHAMNSTHRKRPNSVQRAALSTLRSSEECVELLEPLTGAARAPYAVHSGCYFSRLSKNAKLPGVREVSKYDLNYLLPTNGCSQAKVASCENGGQRLARSGSGGLRAISRSLFSNSPRSIFYDLGCSQYRDVGRLAISGGYGSSLPLFIRLYKQNCIEFDAIYAWEAKRYNKDKWWSTVPAQVTPKLTFYNEPVTEAMFIAKLTETARREDFVVLKR